MDFQIPPALKAEHEELHAELARATKAGGRTGEAAKAVAKLMHPHFIKEEEYALPPLGLLEGLSKGKIESGMADALKMTDKLEAELPQMLAEHKAIVQALESLVGAAKAENKPDYVHFAEKLMAHARTEEEVSYPTALLVGRYLKAVLPGSAVKAA
ncbi:MAG TPA: hemerythrin domain-containing protein [Pseudolabrys sp.]